MDEIILKVGQKYKLKGNFLTRNYTVIYSGMPNEQTISIAFIFSEGYQALAYNLYYPKIQRCIELELGTIEVLHVNSDSLRCLITKK